MSIKEFYLDLAPFSFHIKTDSPLVVNNLQTIYSTQLYSYAQQISDYSVSLTNGRGLRRFVKPQAQFFADQSEPFKPVPYNQGYAFLEWGLNWTVAAHEFQHTVVHSAVLAQDDKAILFPAPPGSGKSTLTAYLAFHGWRLLSDEMALIKPNSFTIEPAVRPICLKNDSISLAKAWFPDGQFSTTATNTHKGDVIHLSPPADSWVNYKKTAEIRAIVFPRYQADVAELQIYQLNQTQAFMQFAENAFNYGVTGSSGFDTCCQIIEQVKVFEVVYQDLAELNNFLLEEVI